MNSNLFFSFDKILDLTYKAERSQNWDVSFQIPASPVQEGIINFHHELFALLTGIVFIVLAGLIVCLYYYAFDYETGKFYFNDDKKKELHEGFYDFTHLPTLEIIWTIIPAAILAYISIPSFSLLYSIDEIIDSFLTIKVIGHQWYWSYEFLDSDFLFQDILSMLGVKPVIKLESSGIWSYDSYMKNSIDELQSIKDRLLVVDNKVNVPVEANTRIIVTSADVLHSWAIPALGIKMDACPGRLNQTSIFTKRPGNFYGQCSEICGANHGFMPIAVSSLDVLGDGTRLEETDKIEVVKKVYNYFSKGRSS